MAETSGCCPASPKADVIVLRVRRATASSGLPPNRTYCWAAEVTLRATRRHPSPPPVQSEQFCSDNLRGRADSKQRLRTPYVKVIAHNQGRAMAIKRQPSFNSTSFLAKVGDGRSVGKYRKGQVVFSQGDAGDAVFYVQKGKVKVTVISEQGKEAIVAILGTDEFFGEGCLAGQTLRISTVTTMMDSVVARIEKAAIIRVIHQEPTFAEMFIAHLLS